MPGMISGPEALARLREGNQRFVASMEDTGIGLSESRRRELVYGQEPFAVILGCSDSRVPAELVFRQGFGDLFVIRVAGNIVAPSQVGSVEFAVSRFGTRLVVVLGHTECSAITATIEELGQPGSRRSPGLRALVDRIQPAVEPLLTTPLSTQPDALAAHAVRANIRMAASHLRHGSAMLERHIERDGLLIVGAEYCLRTGVVDFFDGVPD
ncbi:MAG TPA: carbonic anhydrase [Steroidobacteraceae bacterium]|nr:carbonic anhydrase [Steroidobacteraceae bacterium]